MWESLLGSIIIVTTFISVISLLEIYTYIQYSLGGGFHFNAYSYTYLLCALKISHGACMHDIRMYSRFDVYMYIHTNNYLEFHTHEMCYVIVASSYT